MLNKLMKKLKTKTGMMYGIMLLTSLVLGLSYGTFIFVTDGYKATEMLVSNLMYGIEISSTGGTETINNTNVTISNGNTSTVLVKITSLNKINSKYGLDYKILSGTGNIYYASSTGWLPTGKINKNGSGIYEKTIKVVISATSDLTVDFNVSGGYTYNSEVASKSTYTRVSEVYDNILSYTTNKLLSEIVSEEANDGIYGGDSTNNYLQYPESSNVNENIWRIIGNYKSVGGIKLISNPKEIISVSDINTKLTNIYNTLDKTSEYVLSTNKFNCTGTTCTTSNYSNIGLLSSSEYNSDSYMNITDNWFTTNNNGVELVSGETISSTDTTTTGSLRASIYLQGDVSIKGSGTSTDPYRLVEKGDVIISSATLNGTTLSYFPTMSSPYLVNSVTCSNGTTGTWDNKKDKIVLDNINLPTVCNVDFKDGYTVNLTSTGGSIPSSVQVGRNGIATITLNPADGYFAEGVTTDCPNSTINGNILTITNIKSSGLSCNIEFEKDYGYSVGSLANRILKDNPTVQTRTDFSVANTDNTTRTIYLESSTATAQYTEDVNGDGIGEKTYYYSGNPTNNWVKFGGKVYYRGYISETSTNYTDFTTLSSCQSSLYNYGCEEVLKEYYWKIIRINEDGSVRLLYHGLDHTSFGDREPSYSSWWGYRESNRYYSDYIGSDGEESGMKKTLDDWYSTNLMNYSKDTYIFDKYISKTAIYCSDNTYAYSSSKYDFTAANQRYSNKRPSYKCGGKSDGTLYLTEQRLSDKYSVSTASGGNGKLTYPVALPTIDELVYGGKSYDSSYSTRFYFNSNSENDVLSGRPYLATFSPGTVKYNEGITSNGEDMPMTVSLNYNGESTLLMLLHPVVSLKSCVKYSSGDGTADNPYQVVIDDVCANADN